MTRALLILLLTGCGGVIGTLPRVDTAPAAQTDGPRLAGEDCSFTFMGGQGRGISPRVALDHALNHTGTSTLVDVQISIVERGIWLFGERCVRVEGRLP